MSEKRTQIIEAAVRLFHRDGFWKTSTAAIANEAGIANGTLFNYFTTKAELIEQTFAELKVQLAHALRDGFPEDAPVEVQARAIWNRYYHWHLDHPVEHNLLNQLRMCEFVSADIIAAQKENFTFATRVFDRGVSDGTLTPLPLAFIGAFTESSLEAAIRHARNTDASGKERDDICTMAFEVYWRALAR